MRKYFLFIHEENKWYSGGKTFSIRGRKSFQKDTKRDETMKSDSFFVFNRKAR